VPYDTGVTAPPLRPHKCRFTPGNWWVPGSLAPV